MRTKVLILIVFSTLLLTCSGKSGNQNKNIYQDKTLRDIYSLQDQRDSDGLLPYFKNEDPKYRKYAAMAFASVQNKEAVGELITLLSDENSEVRKAAAYSLGQIGDESAEKGLIDNFRTEGDGKVKMVVLEALGKCGGDISLELLGDPLLSGGSQVLMKGQALGIYRAVLRKKYTEKGIKTVIGTLLKKGGEVVRFYSANILTRIKGIDLSGYFSDLSELIGDEKNLNVKMNLINSLGKCKGPEVVPFLKTFIREKENEKIVISTIRALSEFDYNEISDVLFKLSLNKNYHTSVTASEILIRKDNSEDNKKYFEIAKRTIHWRVAANLFKLSLKFSPDRSEISFIIKNHYKKSEDPYKKGALLIALSEDPDNYPFVEEEVFNSKSKVVSTSGMTSISQMMLKKGFDPEKIIEGGKGTHSIRKVFADIFRRGVISGDSSLITISLSALRDPQNKFRKVVSDLAFLKNSLKENHGAGKEGIRRDIEKTLNYFLRKEIEYEKLKSIEKPLDWDRIVSIPVDQKIKIITEEGEILIRLFVNESPGSVSNFLDLIEKGYLGKGSFHRVVPNFVIQDGCPRGDGWGGPDTTIRSEFSALYYEEGSLGMASGGKDTEGSQWFITHSSTPHLDGRYTIFGKVVEGMDIVDRIEVGTKISGYKIL